MLIPSLKMKILSLKEIRAPKDQYLKEKFVDSESRIKMQTQRISYQSQDGSNLKTVNGPLEKKKF